MNRSLFLMALLFLSTPSFAQDKASVGDILDLEERIMLKKMTDELSKPNPNAPPPAQVIFPPPAPKIVYPTETHAVYGTSATFYEGRLSMGGRVHTVRSGTHVEGYVVSSIGPSGIELTKHVAPKKGIKKHGSSAAQKVTLFAPLVLR
jgi:hypothetical protein